jgi:hypothetical protein
MPVRAVDDKPSDTLVVVSGEGFWTGSSTLPHLHQLDRQHASAVASMVKEPANRQGIEPTPSELPSWGA